MQDQQEILRAMEAGQKQRKYNDQFGDESGVETDRLLKSKSCYESSITICGDCSGCLRTWLPCCCFCCEYPYMTIEQNERGLLKHNGKFQKVLMPGFHRFNICTNKISKETITTEVLDLQKQVIITKDNITLQLDASIFYRIFDVRKAVYRITDYKKCLNYMAISSFRIVGALHTLQQFLEERESISELIKEYLDENTDDWGIKVEEFFIKDLIINASLSEALSSAAKEKKLAEAKIISAKSDVESAKMMREAAELLNTQAAMQIRYLEVVNHISQANNEKLVFVPLDQESK